MTAASPAITALRAVIFDLDGVIADSHPVHEQAWSMLFAEQGIDPRTLDLRFLYAGHPRRAILLHYLGPLPDEKLSILGQRKQELFDLACEAMAPKPGVMRVLDELDAAGIRYGVATSAARSRSLSTLQKFGIAERFAAIVTGEDVRRAKPAPDIFLAAASLMYVAPESALVIEDSVAGVQAARAAGVKCVAYVPLERIPELADAGADALITEFPPNMPAHFQRLFAPLEVLPFAVGIKSMTPKELGPSC